jgi:hypothetical protein
VSIYIEEEHPNTKGDAVAKGILTERIPDAWALEAITKPNAKIMWDWIRSKYTSGSNQVMIDQQMEMLENVAMSSTQSIGDHVEFKTKVAAALTRNKQMVSDGKLKNAIVSTLPAVFESHRASLLGQILDKDTDTCVYRIKLTANLIGFDDSAPRKQSVNTLSRGLGSAGRGRGRGFSGNFTPICYWCKSPDHTKPGCELWKAEQQRRRQAEMDAQRAHSNHQAGPSGQGFNQGGHTPTINRLSVPHPDSGIVESRWLLDNAATCHVCNDIRLMHEVKWYPKPQSLKGTLGIWQDGRSAIGKVKVKIKDGQEVTLNGVEYCPTSDDNILSVRQARKDGINFGNNKYGEIVSIVYVNGEKFIPGMEDAQELIFVDLPVVPKVPLACVTRTCTDYDLWHKRLGHPGVSTFERMQKENMVNGMPTNVTQGVHDHAECDVCLRGK